MITKSKIFVVLLLFAVVGFFLFRVVEERAERRRMIADRMTMQYGALMVGVAVASPYGMAPMSFNVALMSEIAGRLALRPAFFNTPWDRIFDELDSGIYDAVIPSVPVAPQAARNFTRPYVANPLVMVLLNDSPLAAASPAELDGFAVAFPAYDQAQYSFAELAQGRLDAVVTHFLAAHRFVAPADSPFVIAWKSPEPDLFALGIETGNDRLAGAVNGALQAMFADGTMLRISMEIFGVDMVTQAREAW